MHSTYTLAHNSWGNEEMKAVTDVMFSGMYTMGERVAKFEQEFARYIGSRNAVMVNSGSSANLVALSALVYCKKYGINPGDEVIVPAVSWSTTYFPIHQLGLKMVLVDIDKDTLNIDVSKMIEAITDKTRAVLAVNLLGSAENITVVRDICRSRSIHLIEDNCESLGAVSRDPYRGGAAKSAGTFGVCGTFSFFFSHHIQTMEGGMIVTDDDELADYMRSIRAHGWVRDLRGDELYKKTGDKFADSFKFVLPGYCVRPLEMSAAVGSVQLTRMPYFMSMRVHNACKFVDLVKSTSAPIRAQDCSLLDSSWFGFAIVLEGSLRGRRAEVVEALRLDGVECRPIVTGNFANQPVMNILREAGARVHSTLDNAQEIDENGLFIGNDNRDLTEWLSVAIRCIERVAYYG